MTVIWIKPSMGFRAKILYGLLLILLAYLAVQPHWPSILRESAHFIEAWQTLRAGAGPQNETSGHQPSPAASSRNEPRRSLSAPTPTSDQSTSGLDTEADGFLRDVRQRAKASPEDTLVWLQEAHSGGERLRGMLEVVALWAADDSEAALLWLESNAQGLARIETLQSGVELWAARDPQATAQWVEGMARDGSQTAAARALAKQWALNAPELAAQWVASLPAGETATAASVALVESWAASDPEAAAIWALTQAEYRGNERALETSIRIYTQKDPSSAEAFIRELAQAYPSPTPENTYVQALATEDPQSAATWFARLDPSDPIYSDQQGQLILKTWAETDSIAASAWLSEQPRSPRRDAAIAGFVETIERFEPAAATAWAASIEAPELRLQQLERSLKSWARQSADAARTWLKSAELAPDLRSALAAQIGN